MLLFTRLLSQLLMLPSTPTLPVGSSISLLTQRNSLLFLVIRMLRQVNSALLLPPPLLPLPLKKTMMTSISLVLMMRTTKKLRKSKLPESLSTKRRRLLSPRLLLSLSSPLMLSLGMMKLILMLFLKVSRALSKMVSSGVATNGSPLVMVSRSSKSMLSLRMLRFLLMNFKTKSLSLKTMFNPVMLLPCKRSKKMKVTLFKITL